MVRSIFIGLNYFDLEYYPFMISLDKSNRSCNVLSPKKCVPKRIKYTNVKVFNMTVNENEGKIMRKHF